MRTSITYPEVKSIYARYGARISENDLLVIMAQCNEQADIVYTDVGAKPMEPRTAEQWAHFFAKQYVDEQSSDDIAMDRFQAAAYGE